MKTRISLITSLLVLLFIEIKAQDSKFFTKNSYAKFYSEALLENIEAYNEQVQSIIDIATNNVAITVPINGFVFEKSLMKEHFNENYMETEKYPRAEFKGQYISEVPLDISKNGSYEVVVKGNLTIHGVTKPLTTKGIINIENNTLTATTTFFVKLEDYKIKIPRVVFQNIAEEVEVSVKLKYLPFKS